MDTMRYKYWKENYFWKGKTIGIYIMMLDFAIFSILMYIHRENSILFILLFANSVISYAVFTDLYAHLWYDNYNNSSSFREYLGQFLLLFIFIHNVAYYSNLADLYGDVVSRYQGDNTLKGYLKKIISGRTHDIYGLVAIGGITLFIYQIQPILMLVLLVLTLIALALVFKTKFYH